MEVTQDETAAPSEATTGDDQGSEPFMVDIMSGPNYPLAKAFEMAGWRIFAVDLLFRKEHDLSKLDNQETIRRRLKQADFIWAALDCSDKSRIREIPRKHADGRAMPSPLRSVEFPMGVPELQGHNKERVAASNVYSWRAKVTPIQRRNLWEGEPGEQSTLVYTYGSGHVQAGYMVGQAL